jgi:transcriptional regulator with XRE-family HTH domain
MNVGRFQTDNSIGERIHRRRQIMGLSIRQVADRAGVSPSTLSRVERGLRGADNRFLLASLAEALRCSVADLTGLPPSPIDRGTAETAAGVHDTIRAAIEADLRDAPLAPPDTMAPLVRELDLVVDLRMRCDYTGARQRLPALLRGLHAAAFGPDRAQALRCLVLAYAEAASVVRYSGDPRGAYLISERAQQAAECLEDPVLLGLAAFSRAHSASGCGLYDRGARIADRAATDLEPTIGAPGAPEVLGMLHLTVGFCRCPIGGLIDAVNRLATAEALAERTGESTTLGLMFGPTNVRLWRISMETDGGDPGRAVAIARNTDPALIPATSRQTAYYLDTGRALTRINKDPDAIRMLLAAERTAPQRVRASPIAAETVRTLLERSRRSAMGTQLRGLCSRMGIA